MINSFIKHLLVLTTLGIFSTSNLVLAELQDQSAAKSAAPIIKPVTSQAFADTVHWIPFEQGVKSSRESGKPIFLFCYGSWCGYSQKMIARPFHDSTVVQYLNSFFTPIKIETQSARQTSFEGVSMTEAQVANKEFGVTAVPCIWILEPNGCRIKKIKGYYPAKYLLPELQAVHNHTYGDCQNVPTTDPPTPRPKAQDTSTVTK